MKILVEAAKLSPRMRAAAQGLAMRGHAVLWRGQSTMAPEAVGAARAPEGLALARARADVIVGSATALLRVAFAGRLVNARVAVLDLGAAAPAAWSFAEWLAWDAHHGMLLIEPAAAAGARAQLPERLLERAALWSDDPAGVPDPAHADTEVLERACERALARHRGQAPRAAVFLDRDGTLIVEHGYLADPGGVSLLPGAAAALKRLRAAGLALIVISNQSGVGRGRYTLTRAHEVMARMRQLFRAEGVELDGIYFCPHRPDEGCACRKPETGLLERAAEDHQLSLARSVMVGDKRIDVETGQRAGGSGVLVRTGYGGEEEDVFVAPRPPDFTADDLVEASVWIAERGDALAV